jgi:branched-chain amino acid transport system permease protein
VIEVAFVNPDTFPVGLSILLLASVVIGGLGSLGGVIFGALVLEFLPVYSQSPPLIDADFSTQAPSVVFGALLIAIVFLLPGGFAGLLRRLGLTANKLASRATQGRARPAPTPSDS